MKSIFSYFLFCSKNFPKENPKRKEKKILKENNSVQEWITIDKLLEDGILKTKSGYLKLIKINPINYNLKSEMEKEAILNSYKLFLKTCNFEVQILIQSKKENLSQHIQKIEEKIEKQEKESLRIISQEYIQFIQELNSDKKFLSKTFYMIIKCFLKNDTTPEIKIKQDLKENYLKIKECLARCGNYVEEIKEKEELKKILNSFFYVKNDLNRLNIKKEEIK